MARRLPCMPSVSFHNPLTASAEVSALSFDTGPNRFSFLVCPHRSGTCHVPLWHNCVMQKLGVGHIAALDTRA